MFPETYATTTGIKDLYINVLIIVQYKFLGRLRKQMQLLGSYQQPDRKLQCLIGIWDMRVLVVNILIFMYNYSSFCGLSFCGVD